MSLFSNTYFCLMITNNVEQYFKTFIDDNKLNTPKIKFLLAVSGGVDSIVLLSLFIKSKLNFLVSYIFSKTLTSLKYNTLFL